MLFVRSRVVSFPVLGGGAVPPVTGLAMICKLSVPEIPLHAFTSVANTLAAVFVADIVFGIIVVLLAEYDAHLAAWFVASLHAYRKNTPLMVMVAIAIIGKATTKNRK
jgi:hypothetical protein